MSAVLIHTYHHRNGPQIHKSGSKSKSPRFSSFQIFIFIPRGRAQFHHIKRSPSKSCVEHVGWFPENRGP